jgi:hypothetical protein
MTMAGATSAEYNIQTGLVASQIFPATIIYSSYITKQFLNSRELTVPQSNLKGTKIFAHCDSNSMLLIDSVRGKTKTDSLFSITSIIVNRIYKQIIFPETNLKIGDSFNQNTPFTLPIPSGNMPVMVNTIYKLISVKDQLGFFDIVQTAKINMKTDQGDVDVIATGTGKMVFSIKNHFPMGYTSDMILKFKLNMAGITAEGEGKVSTEYATEIN